MAKGNTYMDMDMDMDMDSVSLVFWYSSIWYTDTEGRQRRREGASGIHEMEEF